MTWIKLQDNVPRHPKIAGLSDRAFRYWIHGLCYAAEYLTDGVLPAVFLGTVPVKVARELLAAGLWYDDQEYGAVFIHDYLKYQTSKAWVEAERTRNRKRRTGGGTGGTPPVVPEKTRDQNTEGTSTEDPPKPPVDTGGVRVTREHKQQARVIWRSRLGYCEHAPACPNQVVCTDRIAEDLARKAVASC